MDATIPTVLHSELSLGHVGGMKMPIDEWGASSLLASSEKHHSSPGYFTVPAGTSQLTPLVQRLLGDNPAHSPPPTSSSSRGWVLHALLEGVLEAALKKHPTVPGSLLVESAAPNRGPEQTPPSSQKQSRLYMDGRWGSQDSRAPRTPTWEHCSL